MSIWTGEPAEIGTRTGTDGTGRAGTIFLWIMEPGTGRTGKNWNRMLLFLDDRSSSVPGPGPVRVGSSRVDYFAHP